MIDAKVNVPFFIVQEILDGSGNPATGKTPKVTIYQEVIAGSTISLTKIVNLASMTELDAATPAGIYAYSWTPSVVGQYSVKVDETTIPAHFFYEVLVGNNNDVELSTRLMNLANEGQPVTLGPGAGQIIFTDTLMEGSTPVTNATLRFYNATTIIDSGNSNKTTQIDFSSQIAEALTSSTGSFQVALNPGYYFFTTIDQNGAQPVWYLSLVTATTFTLQQTPINPS